MQFDEHMLIRDALLAHPGAASVFDAHGLPCASCMAASMETVSDVATSHGGSVSALLADLNSLCASKGEDPR
jgi:hybrid cluster-associated redox disulfide protein